MNSPPPVQVVITGKGPLKEQFEEKLRGVGMRRVEVMGGGEGLGVESRGRG